MRKKSLAELRTLATAKGRQEPGHRDVTARQYERTRAVLLADAGREPSDQAAVRGDGRKDRRLAGGDG